MRRSALALVILICGPALCVRAADVAWVRILSGDGEAVNWRPGQGWPARPSGFPFAPSAVLSYATLKPGDSMPDIELEGKAEAWARELEESRRFPRSSVLVAELEEGSGRRGIIVEAEAGTMPLFDGGAAYAQVTVPLLNGKRSSLTFQAGPNLASAAFQDEALGDKPLVLEASVAYANDLLESGSFIGNRLDGALAFGLRLGPQSRCLFRCRTSLPGDGDAAPMFALEPAIDLAALSLFGQRYLDGSLAVRGDAYMGSSSLRCDASSGLQYGRGRWSLSLATGVGLSSGTLGAREAFDLRQGEGLLRGPALSIAASGNYALARLDAEFMALDLPLSSWFKASLGPFAFCEAASASGLDGAAVGDVGAGIRIRLGLPVGVTADLGYALSDRGIGALVISVLRFDSKTGKELR